jgi:ribosomal protein S17E
MRIKNLLEGKNHEIAQLNLEYLASTDKLKNEVIALSNEIVHLNHLRKMELSEQKIMFEGMLDNLSKDHHKEKEILIMGFNAEGKKLMNVIAGLQSELSQLGEVTKIGEIQQNTREL